MSEFSLKFVLQSSENLRRQSFNQCCCLKLTEEELKKLTDSEANCPLLYEQPFVFRTGPGVECKSEVFSDTPLNFQLQLGTVEVVCPGLDSTFQINTPP